MCFSPKKLTCIEAKKCPDQTVKAEYELHSWQKRKIGILRLELKVILYKTQTKFLKLKRETSFLNFACFLTIVTIEE